MVLNSDYHFIVTLFSRFYIACICVSVLFFLILFNKQFPFSRMTTLLFCFRSLVSETLAFGMALWNTHALSRWCGTWVDIYSHPLILQNYFYSAKETLSLWFSGHQFQNLAETSAKFQLWIEFMKEKYKLTEVWHLLLVIVLTYCWRNASILFLYGRPFYKKIYIQLLHCKSLSVVEVYEIRTTLK